MQCQINQTGCLQCGQELIYTQENHQHTCLICHQEFSANVSCPDGHFICDQCHSLSAKDLIMTYCLKTDNTNPVEMAEKLMKNGAIKMHGPEHHFLVPAVLLTAYYNKKGYPSYKEKVLKIALDRANAVPGGFCGTHGNCGAAVGSGVFISIVTGSTPLAEEEWRLSNLMTSKSLLSIASNGGPRCCKRDSYLSIVEANEFIKAEFNEEMDIPNEIQCTFSERNGQCLQGNCLYF